MSFRVAAPAKEATTSSATSASRVSSRSGARAPDSSRLELEEVLDEGGHPVGVGADLPEEPLGGLRLGR